MDIVTRYWNDPAAIRQEAGRTGNYGLVEQLAWQDVLKRLLGIGRKSTNILQVGCKSGYLALTLAQARMKVAGVDQSAGLIDIARQRATEQKLNARFEQANYDALPFENGEFDGVVAMHTLSRAHRPARVVNEWMRVLKPGGYLAIIEDAVDTPEQLANTKRWQQHMLALDESALAKQMWGHVAGCPLGSADSATLIAFLQLQGLEDIAASTISGQLARTGSHRLTSYRATLTAISTKKSGSISLATL